jgi:hypothetical protein
MIVQIEIRDDVLAALLARSLENGSSVDELVDELLRDSLEQPIPEGVDLARVLEATLEFVRTLQPDYQFTLEDVIAEQDWDAMTSGDRKSFGKLFRKQSESLGLAEWVRRSSGNKAIYRSL